VLIASLALQAIATASRPPSPSSCDITPGAPVFSPHGWRPRLPGRVSPSSPARECRRGTRRVAGGVWRGGGGGDGRGSRRRMRVLWVYAAARRAEWEWGCALHESRLRGRAVGRYRDEGPSVHCRRVCTPAARRPAGWAVEGATSRPAGSPPPTGEHHPLPVRLVLLPRRRRRPPPQPPPPPLLSLSNDAAGLSSLVRSGQRGRVPHAAVFSRVAVVSTE